MLLSHELSQVPLWGGTWKDRIQRGKDLAVTIIPDADVGRWRASGHTVRRGCYTKHGNPLFEVQISGPKGFKHIFLTRTEGALVGTVGGQNLNGSTPTTAEDLVKLIDQLVG